MFSLSKSSFSRYAGRDWIQSWSDQGRKKRQRIPRLWQNLAQILSGDPAFLEAARQARVLPKIEQVLRSSQPRRLRETRDGQ